MIKNAYVTIVASDELTQMRLDELVGRKGLVVEDLSFLGNAPHGGWYSLKKLIWASLFGSFLKAR